MVPSFGWHILTNFFDSVLYEFILFFVHPLDPAESVQQNISLILTNGSGTEGTQAINLDFMGYTKSSVLGIVCLESNTTLDLLINK